MAENTKIEWAHHTFNPWIGCTKVAPACDHCYAEKERASTVLGVKWGVNMPRHRTSVENWKHPVRWNKEAERLGMRYRVFCASLADVFDNAVPVHWRRDLFDLIEATPHLDWLLLTKRIGIARNLYAEAYLDSARAWPANVWIGASITSQAEADRDIQKLLAVPAAKRFLSMEPLLGPADLRLPTRTWTDSRGGVACDHCCNGDRCDDPTHYQRGRPDFAPHCRCPHCRGTGRGRPIDWVIVGGESGPHARPMHPDWARSLRDQCQAAGVPFLFKQWGEWAPEIDAGTDKEPGIWVNEETGEPGTESRALEGGRWQGMFHVGKKAAGRLLDGRTWDEVPA